MLDEPENKYKSKDTKLARRWMVVILGVWFVLPYSAQLRGNHVFMLEVCSLMNILVWDKITRIHMY